MRLAYSVLYVQDVNKSVAFYEAAFGLTRKLVKESGLYAEMETGATTLAFSHESLMPGLHPSRPNEHPGAAEIAFFTDNVQSAYNQAIKAGAISHVAPHTKEWGQDMAHVRDIDGHLVELCTPPAP